MRFTIRRATIDPLLRDKFDVFGEQVISLAYDVAFRKRLNAPLCLGR